MKRKMLFAGFICLLIVGCAVSNSPAAVTKNFFAAVQKNDTAAMGKYATPETIGVMTMFGTKLQGAISAYGKITGTTETIDGDTAIVTLSFENGEDTEINLKKIDGKWKVHMSMEK
jgi:2-methylaconitate cis-trans-isomerase PrpF